MDEHQLFETALAVLAFYLKEDQKTALESFYCKKSVLAVLPTGYGKSLIYQLAPLVAGVYCCDWLLCYPIACSEIFKCILGAAPQAGRFSLVDARPFIF